MTTDPVCGMAVDTTSTYRHDDDGHSWWFCSTHCRDEFIAESASFAEVVS